MGAGWAWAARELRRRPSATIVLAVLIGCSWAVALGALAGARRTETAFDRLLESTATSDARLQYIPAGADDDEVAQALVDDPSIEMVVPMYIVIAFVDSVEYDLSVVSGPDERLFREIDRPRVLDGRLPDPDAPDEVLVNEFVARVAGVGVGDRIDAVTYSPDQLEREAYFEEPAGPLLELTVAGVGRLADDVAEAEFTGMLGTPAFFDAYWGEAAGYGPTLNLSLEDGVDAAATVEGALRGADVEEPEVTTADDLRAAVEDGTHATAVGLLAFALAAALAAAVASAQALNRRLAGAADDQAALQAIGLTRGQRTIATALVAVPAVVGGVSLAVVLALATSRWMPTGTARRAEPDPGVEANVLLLGASAAAICLGLLGVGAFSAWQTARRARARSRAGGPLLLGRLLRSGGPPPVQLGVTMAVEAGTGPTAVPVRSALVGAVLGVTGIVAALTFDASLDLVDEEPARYGWNWTLAPDVERADLAALAEVDGVRDVGELVHRQVVVEGQQLLGIAVSPQKGSPSLTVRSGRMPISADEVALGPLTADHLGASAGDVITAAGADGPRQLTVVGEVLFPVFNENPFNEGVALHTDTIENLAVSEGFEQGIVTFDPGISDAEGAGRLLAAIPESVSVYSFPSPPPEIVNLGDVATLPPALAAFLLVLALAAVGHAVATSVSRRRRDLGTVRALGFEVRQVRRTIRVQAAVLLAVGVLVGTPLGMALGRVVWRLVASALGVQAVSSMPALAMVLLVPAALLAIGLVAALPARAAALQRPVDALRSE